ncbi:MAG: hypothetical protein KTR32_16130 [Granulosicoccus sp.]|nr:hypothetical protein [Granulosicoccus sp.]
MWQQSCLPSTDEDFERSTLDIDSNSFVITQSSFSDQECNSATQAVTFAGTFTEGELVPVSDRGNATAIDLTISSVALTFSTEELVTAANGAGLCGINNWAINVSSDISNCNAVDGTAVPSTLYDIYLLEGEQLFTGDETGDTPEARPVLLAENEPYFRITTSGPDDGVGPVDDNTNGELSVPENSAAINADNGVSIAQFIIDHYEIIKGLSNAINTGILSNQNLVFSRPTSLALVSQCEGGGQASLNGTPAISQSLVASYTDCIIDGRNYTGTLNLQFNAISGDLSDTANDWFFSARVSLDGLTVTTSDRTVELDGNPVFSTVYRAATEIEAGVVSRFQGTQGEVANFTEASHVTRLTDFDYLFIYNQSVPVLYSDSIDEARIASTLIDGIISVEQQTGFAGNDFLSPFTGSLDVLGAAGSSLNINVLDLDDVTIAVDANGNSSTDDEEDLQIQGTWTEFFGL